MTATYCTDDDIKAIFGVSNWTTWCDLDNDESGSKIAARSDEARVHGYNDINDRLRRSHYTIPFTGTVPHEIGHLESRIAGLLLMSARGQEDEGPSMKAVRDDVDKTFEDILAGNVRLDA